MKCVLIIGLHLLAIILLWLLGLQLDNIGGSHPGVSLVFSAAWTIYATRLSLQATLKELQEERDALKDLLPG
ncbi:MAG TPA: hypothetical protein VGX70_13205 [Gemmataceae bacterium]|jgi:hypothetical protein|nr:hypothetical protein [Gemmataceae bacterium]